MKYLFKALDRMFAACVLFIVFSVILSGARDAMGAGPLLRSERALTPLSIDTSSTTATLINSTTNLVGLQQFYNEFCWHNEDTNPLEFVRISTFAHTDETNLPRWSSPGGEKECHDWGTNIPIFVFHDDGEASKRITFLFAL